MLVSDKIRTERFVQRLVTLILSKLQSSNFSFGVGQYHGTLLYFGQCVKLQNVSSIGWFSMKFSEPGQSLTNVPIVLSAKIVCFIFLLVYLHTYPCGFYWGHQSCEPSTQPTASRSSSIQSFHWLSFEFASWMF